MIYSVFVEHSNGADWEPFERYEDAYDYFIYASTNNLRQKISVELYQEIDDVSVLLVKEVIK
jgi:hypothetical protein